MPATFAFSETNGAPPGTAANITGGSINFGNADLHSDSLVPADHPVTAGNNSFEKWIRGRWTGTFTSITNTKFYKSAGTALSGSRIMKGGVTAIANYTAPTSSASTVATDDMENHTSAATALTPLPPGSGAGKSGDPNFSEYVVLQLVTTTAAPPGAIPTQTYTMQWDET
jgi:hypothetical protein